MGGFGLRTLYSTYIHDRAAEKAYDRHADRQSGRRDLYLK